jgi:hypothetical protein
MSHTHFCHVARHPWRCESSECICMCKRKMERGDHSRCPIELRACPEHDDECFHNIHCGGSTQEANDDRPSATTTEENGWV